MTDPNYTHLSIVVDRSGSMSGLAADATGGINQLIRDQAALDGKITVSLYDFDTHYQKVFGPLDAKEAPEYTLVPRGGTALFDAVNRSIHDTGTFLRNLPEALRPGKVVFVIVTDGEENSSVEVKNASVIKEQIQHQERTYDWQFMFLASGIDSFATGTSLGMTRTVQMSGTGASHGAAYAGLSHSVTALRSFGGDMASYMASSYDAQGNATDQTIASRNDSSSSDEGDDNDSE